ncbi:hypothetical protein [Actinoplanes teichomyceticus]|uniref:hypothetical protein n=1 Tax=Actinoplanes teichomyceticus TaxID=1867 RepID=UPI0011A8EADE|nr:hypothetical protein [Actinoplanes teichomyceticus]
MALAVGVLGALASVVALVIGVLTSPDFGDTAVQGLLWSGYILCAAAVLFAAGRYLGAGDD